MSMPRDAVSTEGHAYFLQLHETPAFGASGSFDLDELRQGMGTRREPTDPSVRCIPWQHDELSGEWVVAADADTATRVLYLHGGGFVSGCAGFYLAMAAHLSAAARCAVLLLDYRLAPEHPFPAAIEDSVRAFESMVATGPHGSGQAGNCFIAGDSAGGGLTLSTLLALRDRGRPLPRGAIALSAFADLTLTGESLTSEEALDPIMSPQCLPQFVGHYLGHADPQDPYASPIYADYTGFPPLLLQVGEHEIIRNDSVLAAAKARSFGVETTLEIWPGMFHVFPSHEPLLPEGEQAIEHMAAFIRKHRSAD
ncbi:MAG: alpha/beta hydrolase [Gemmatimonadetes bacterium]|nr:alpha/beta hydrolase [Gemmatimonadota bacterium]